MFVQADKNMHEITLTINKAHVYDEVAKVTSYAGKKMTGEEGAYERIFTTDEDRQVLERFWIEACNAATEQFKQFIESVSSQPESRDIDLTRDYVVVLSLSSAFDVALADGMQSSLFSYFVSYIAGRWFKFTNKAEAESYGADALGMMGDVVRKLWHRKKPTRVQI